MLPSRLAYKCARGKLNTCISTYFSFSLPLPLLCSFSLLPQTLPLSCFGGLLGCCHWALVCTAKRSPARSQTFLNGFQWIKTTLLKCNSVAMKAVSETAGKQQKRCVFWDIGATLIFALWCPSHVHISMGCTVICLVGRLVSLVDEDVCGRLGHYLKGQRGVWCHPLFCLAPSKLYQALLLMWYLCDRRGTLINNDLVQDGSLRKWLKRVSNKLQFCQKVSLQLAQPVLLSFPKQMFQKVSMQKYESKSLI